MALNISRLFKRTPEVAAGDVNGDGTVDARDAAANHGGRPAGIMQDYYAHSNANGHEGDTASHEAVVSGHGGRDESALDAGFSISDDLANTARTAQDGLGANNRGGLGVKWEGPDFDATKDSLVTELGFPKVDGSDKSFTSAEGRSMTFELLKDGGANPGATERSAGPGHGLRDMEIDLGHGGTLNHGDGPDVEALRSIILKQPGSYTATDDLWKFRGEAQDGSGTDNANRTMGPGHAGSGFMMQDGELYPRGILPFMEGQNFTGSDEQMEQLLGRLREKGLIDTSTGEVVWADEVAAQSSDDEINAMVSWLRGNGLIDTSTGEVAWVHQPGQHLPPTAGWAGAGAEASFDAGSRTAGHQGAGFMMQDGELYPRGILPFMEGQNFTGSDEQMEQLVSHLRQNGLIDTSTGEVVWAGGAANQPPSISESGDIMAWLRGQGLIDTSTGEVVWVGQNGAESGGPGFLDLDGMPAGTEVLDAPGSGSFEQAREPGAAGVLPEVNDEVLVSFSALEADADAPTTLVDLHSHGANTEGLVGQLEIPHLDPGHHDLGGGHHGHGFMDYTDDAAIDN